MIGIKTKERLHFGCKPYDNSCKLYIYSYKHCKCDWTNTGEKQGLSQQLIELDLENIGPKLDWVFHSFLKANASLYAG